MTIRQAVIILRSLTAVTFLITAISVPMVASSKPTKSQLEKARKINAAKIKKRKAKTRSGAYVTGGVGLIGSGSTPDNVDLSDGTGLSLGVGYRFTPQLAVEGGLLLGQYDVASASTSNDNTNDSSANEASLLGASLSLKYFIPIDAPRVEGYGQIGLGTLRIENLGETELDGTTIDFGGGIDYRISKELAVGAKVGYLQFLGDDGAAANVDDDFSSLNGMITLTFQL